MEPRDEVNEYLRSLYQRSLEAPDETVPYGLGSASGMDIAPPPEAAFVREPTRFAPDLISQGERLVAEQEERRALLSEFEPKSYMEALKQAQQQDRAAAIGAGVLGSAEQIARIASRGVYQPTGGARIPSAVSELERRRAAVTDFLTQQRAAEREAQDADYKRALISRMEQPRAAAGKTEEERAAFVELTEERAETERARQEALRRPPAPRAAVGRGIAKEKPPARDYAGERRADYERRLREGVPTGYELRPGAQPTTKQREEAARLTVSNDIVKESVADVRSLLAMPNAVANPQTRDLLKQQGQFIKTQLRVLEDLGVPSGPDAQILDQLIGDPASVTGEVLNTTVKKLDALTKYVNTRVQTTAYRYGLQPSAPVRTGQPGAQETESVRVKRKSDGRIVEVPRSSVDALLKSNAIEVIP